MNQFAMSGASQEWLSKFGSIAAAIAILAFLTYTGVQMFSGESVESYRSKFVQVMNQDLQNPGNGFRKRIEKAHVTVQSTDARITRCAIRTIDGSQNAGKNGSNVGEVDFVVTIFWNGLVQKDGFTEIRVVFDPATGKVKSSDYVGGNAVFNKETIDWVQVGQDLAPILLIVAGS